MYRWYWNAEICYAFLCDLHLDRLDVEDVSLEYIRWFRRGWCLQELLAPAVVEFYNSEWICVGTKSSAATSVSALTGIDQKYLVDRETIKEASVATRFSWASGRETTRVEDIAYCLLGLVDVNMPLLYGERHKAFYRLQTELIQKSNEQTIFAWDPRDLLTSYSVTGMLAPHPSAFKNSTGIVMGQNGNGNGTFEMTNGGLRIQLPLHEEEQSWVMALLSCETASGDGIGIWLRRRSDDQYIRDQDELLERIPQEEISDYDVNPSTLLVQNWAASPPPRTSVPSNLVRISVALSGNFDRFQQQEVLLDSETMTQYSRMTMLRSGFETMELPPVTSKGLLFADHQSSFMVVLGTRDGILWSAIIPEVITSSASTVLRVLSQEVRQGKEVWKYLGDHRTATLSEQLRVALRAKKRAGPVIPAVSFDRHNSSLTIWDVTLTIEDLAIARDDELILF